MEDNALSALGCGKLAKAVHNMIGVANEKARQEFTQGVMHGDAQTMEILASLVWEHHHEKEHHKDFLDNVEDVKRARKERVVTGVTQRVTQKNGVDYKLMPMAERGH